MIQQLAKVVMMPISTHKICELLRCFYGKVSQSSRQFSQKQQKLQSILLKFQQINVFDQSEKVQIQKNSHSTQQSTEIAKQPQNSSKSNKKNEKNLYFTFNMKCEQKMSCQSENIRLKFSSQSLSKLIIFSIFFNHHYVTKVVENSRSRIADIVNHDRSIVSLIRKTLLSLKQNKQVDKDAIKSETYTLLEKYLDSNDEQQMEFFIQDLKYFIDNLDEQIANSFVQKLLENNINYRQGQDLCSKAKQSSQKYQQFLLSSLSECAKMKIVFQQRKLRLQWGSNRSILYLMIKKSQTKKQYSLKEMSYYSKCDLAKSENLTNNIKISHII